MKKQKTVSIKAKLLGVIIPVVIAIVVVLVVVAYQISAGIIKKYSQNLLQSSVENQASQIEAWLNENLASFQMAKTTIENLKPYWTVTMDITAIIRMDFMWQIPQDSL